MAKRQLIYESHHLQKQIAKLIKQGHSLHSNKVVELSKRLDTIVLSLQKTKS